MVSHPRPHSVLHPSVVSMVEAGLTSTGSQSLEPKCLVTVSVVTPTVCLVSLDQGIRLLEFGKMHYSGGVGTSAWKPEAPRDKHRSGRLLWPLSVDGFLIS